MDWGWSKYMMNLGKIKFGILLSLIKSYLGSLIKSYHSSFYTENRKASIGAEKWAQPAIRND
jgi:hypothetical protein